jgi:phosphatidylglycerol:prolipoprotein diacylglycerol transferase
VPLGYTFGRIGNFINGEHLRTVTNSSLGHVFPLDPLHELRHPSQLYEAFFEGIVLFAILWASADGVPFDGFLFASYLFGYGLVRFFIEFFREPDAQLGLMWGGVFSMGQLSAFSYGSRVLCLFFAGRRRADRS